MCFVGFREVIMGVLRVSKLRLPRRDQSHLVASVQPL